MSDIITLDQSRPIFPFTAIVGQEEMKLSLILNVIDPKIGGVMIMGASLRARYEAEVGDYKGFFQVGGTHQAHSYSATGNIQTYDQAGFSTYDASLGVGKNAWTAQAYLQNLTNTRANLFENGNQFVTAETINRPRTGGLKFSYKY